MNTAMKMSALLIVMLLGSLELVSSAMGPSAGADCCTKYETKRIPLAMVVSWHQTSSNCTKAAYVFVTKLGRRICVDPTHGWVRSHAGQVDSRSATIVVPGTSRINTKQAEGPNTGANCCTRYDKRKIPLAMVVSWHETSSSCAKAAYVFVTKLGRRICVDPTHGWVRSHAGQVDSRSATIVVPGTSRINTKQAPLSDPEYSSSSLCLQSPVKMNIALKLSALLILVLLDSLEHVSSTEGANTGADCCTSYYKMRIPLAKVVSWHKTSSSCAKAAYVFVTKPGKRICVDPAHGWVRSHAARVDSRSATTAVPGTSEMNTKA